MKKNILLIALMLLPLVANAEEVKIDGLWYNLIPKGQVAEVFRSQGTSYSGDIIIPETVTYEGVDFNVSSIGNRTFSGCTGLSSITIPNSVTTL